MATDFFAAQEAARSRSRHLVALFLTAVVGLIVAIYSAVTALMIFGNDGKGPWWDADVFFWTAGITALIVGVASMGKMMSLRAGGGSVARSVGGRLVDALTQNPDERRLLNIVEEMAIASGVPMPEVYVLDEEAGINAFAAGFTMQDAAVAVTRGCLQNLNRDELQGVIAHEFSHILNGDMRLNIQLIGLVFGLLVLAIVGQFALRVAFYSGGGRRRNNKDGAAFIAVIAGLGLIFYVAGWVGVLFGRLLQSAVSRQREFLADASAVQFTRNPGGLVGALRKIGGAGSRVANPHSQDIAHLFFANGLKMSWWGLFATHPPLEARIRALDAEWDGTYETLPPPLPHSEPAPPPVPTSASMGIPAAFVAAAGTMDPMSRAHTIREQLSQLLGDGWREPKTAADLVFALLPPTPEEGDEVRDDREKLSALAPSERLALVSMLAPTFGRMTAEERSTLLDRLDRMSRASGGFDAFDFGVWWVVRRNLQRLDQSPKPKGKLNKDAADFIQDVTTLIASLAHIGADNEARAVRAFEAAMKESSSFGWRCSYPGKVPDIVRLDQALQHLGDASFALRQEIIAIAARAVTGDGKITDSEAALMQLVSLALDCPAPL